MQYAIGCAHETCGRMKSNSLFKSKIIKSLNLMKLRLKPTLWGAGVAGLPLVWHDSTLSKFGSSLGWHISIRVFIIFVGGETVVATLTGRK